jgi:hypothetical protein
MQRTRALRRAPTTVLTIAVASFSPAPPASLLVRPSLSGHQHEEDSRRLDLPEETSAAQFFRLPGSFMLTCGFPSPFTR